MIAGWFGDSVNKSPTVRSLAEDAMRLSLHVISKAGFGVHMDWPEKSDGKARNEAEKLENGHTMSYIDALGTLLHLILPVLIVPHGLLSMILIRPRLNLHSDNGQKSFPSKSRKRPISPT